MGYLSMEQERNQAYKKLVLRWLHPKPSVWIAVAALLSLGTSCAQVDSSQTSEPLTSPSVVLSSPIATTPTATPSARNPAEVWQDAQERAASATSLATSAQSRDDWSLVSSRWQQAIALLRQIPRTDKRYGEAQTQIDTFQRNLTAARQRANSNIPNVVLTAPVVSPSPGASPGVSPGASPGANGEPATPEVALATHLASIGATYYVSSPCDGCQRQQELFGSVAAGRLTVVTCNASGGTASPDPCRQDNITTFPTWRINGQLYSGVQSLSNLADLSDYRGDRSFSQQ
jgi:hypothetical protein